MIVSNFKDQITNEIQIPKSKKTYDLERQHSAEKDNDIKRDDYLKQQRFKVLRFWNNEVLTNTEAVLEVIRRNSL